MIKNTSKHSYQTKHQYDAIIIGAGHNGLACACYLAKAGIRVLMLERRSIVGGTAVTEEFHPGFRNSTASYTVSLLNPKVIEDLHLKQHGLKILARQFGNFLPLPDNQYLLYGGTDGDTLDQFAKFSFSDAAIAPKFFAMLEQQADLLRELTLQTPPHFRGGIRDLGNLIKNGLLGKKLSMHQRQDLIDLFCKSAAEILDQWFEADAIKALFAFDSVVGNFGSPYTPGSAYVLLHHVFGEVNGKKGIWGHAMGGMGAITQAMLKEAHRLGVSVITEAAVKEIIIKNECASGVVLENGNTYVAKSVISNVGPKLLFLNLIDAQHLEENFLQRIKAIRGGSGTFRMNIALSELPDFTCLPGTQQQPHHTSGIIIAPSMAYMEKAYLDAKSTGWSQQPIIEILIPSTVDNSLAPEGKHVASLFCQQFNPVLPNGQDWDMVREQVADLIIDTVTQHAPNFKASILGRSIFSPLDLERTFGLIDGDIFHGALRLDQLYCNRPVFGYGDYRTPIKGLYLCGAGAHPGGGVTGAPGHNAAREIISDFRWRKI